MYIVVTTISWWSFFFLGRLIIGHLEWFMLPMVWTIVSHHEKFLFIMVYFTDFLYVFTVYMYLNLI
jgi:hypothetical protein